MRSGMDEQAAMTASRATARTLQGTAAAGVVTGGFNEFSPELENLGLALLLAPGGSSLVTRFGHDAAILGKQLQYAQTSSPLFQRIAQLDPADSSLTAVTLDRTSALTIPGTISGLAEGIFAKSRQFGPSPALKAPATALTRTGLGNTLTGAVNATKTAVGASAIPGAIGYAVDGEAGAGGAIAASIPFIATGLGFGTLARYGSQADVRAKMLGDQVYYKDTYLTDTEIGMYDSLAKPVRQAIATSVIQNPDVVYRFQNDRGNSHWSVENGESVVTIFTKSAPQEQLSAVLGHEIAHHIDAFGFMPQILEQLVGSVEKNQPGLFTEYKNGKPIIIKDAEGRDVYATNKEFAKHRQRYLDLLEQSGIDKNSPDYQAYANNDARIAREIFASHGAAWYFGGDFVTRNYQGAGAKMMGAILDPLFSSPGLRKFFHRIGLATQETTGLVADPLRLFPELKEIPALTRMIEKYNDDVRGFGPQARREGRGRGNLVDPEFADEIATASFTAKDLENPAIVNRLKAGGVVKIKDDGSIETDASGKPVFLPSREVNKKNKQLSQDILQIIRKKEDAGETFGEGHVSMEKTADGKERALGRFIDPFIIDELAKTGKYNPHQLAALKQISQTLRNNTGDVWNLFYYSALKWNKAGRKVYGQIKGGDRKSLPFGIEITKDGNINIQTISVDAFKKNLEWFAKSKGYEQKMSEAFGGMNAWENGQNAYKLLPTYLQNHMKGIINGNPESGITPLQRDLINAAIGRVNADQVKANPILEGLGDRRSKRQQSIRSRRLDRIGNAIRGESGFPAFKSAIEQNKVPIYMPERGEGDKLFMPRESKGRNKKILLRTTDEIAESIKAEAKARGISANDVYNERLAKQLPPEQGNLQPKTPQKENDITLTSEELRLLKKTNIGPEDAEAYRIAVEKRRKLAEASILGEKLFMPTSKDLRFMPLSEEIKARVEWLSKTFSSKNFQDFITRKGKPNFALKNKDGDYLPVPWYHGGTIGEGNRGKLKDWTFNDNYIWLSSEKDFSLEFSMYRGADPFLYEAQIRSASDVGNPIMVATNASNVFHYANPKHIKKLRENSALDYYEIEDLKLGEWYDVEPHLKLLRDLGFDGARMKQDGTENVVIFNRKDIKLIKDVNDKNRSVEVSGKFIGEQLFLPQLKFDFDGKGSAVEMSPVSKDRAPTFWKLFKINPKDPKVYDKVADVLIDTGTPTNDPANALDHAGKLGLDPKKLRQAMARAQRRYFNQIGRFYMPTAYHGTPHTLAPEPGAPLGKFRTSAIGTGEGAQAYGHGLYFAGKKEVAEHYRKVLSGDKDYSYLDYDGVSFDRSNPRHEAARRLLNAKRDNKTRSSIIDQIDGQLRRQNLHPSIKEKLREVLNVLQNKDEAKVSGQGSLYKVELAPKENEYLLYDKTLGEQTKDIQDKLRKVLTELEGEDLWEYRKDLDYRDITDNALENVPEPEISRRLKEAGIPGIKYLDGSSRSKGEGDYNYVIFDEADVQITDKLFMPASEAGAGKGKVPKSGDMLTLDDKSLKLFLPSPGNPNASLSEFKGKNVQVLTTDLSMVGDKKIDGATVAFTGGPGYLSVNDAWGFTNESSAKGFRTRWEREGRPLIGLTSMKQDNHKASTLTREYYVRKFMQAINQGKIAESLVNEHIIEALTRAAKGKGLTDSQKRALLSVKNIEDFLRIFSNGQIIPWKATPKIYDRLSQATLPIKQGKLKELGLDLDTILRETRQKEYNDIKKGSLLAIAEYDGSDAVYRPDLNSAYPWSIPLKEKAFLKDFADIQDLSSRQDLRGSDGDANMAVAMGAGVMLDKLGRGDVNFMPSGRPKRQPANRITRQAPAMPGNRFMLPAASAGAKSAERFR